MIPGTYPRSVRIKHIMNSVCMLNFDNLHIYELLIETKPRLRGREKEDLQCNSHASDKPLEEGWEWRSLFHSKSRTHSPFLNVLILFFSSFVRSRGLIIYLYKGKRDIKRKQSLKKRQRLEPISVYLMTEKRNNKLRKEEWIFKCTNYY